MLATLITWNSCLLIEEFAFSVVYEINFDEFFLSSVGYVSLWDMKL